MQENRTALVTGAGVGIGQGIAIRMAREGYDVAVHHFREEEGVLHTASEIEATGRRAVVIQADLRTVDECRRVVDEAVRGLGELNALVNNAGVTKSLDFLETDPDTYNDLFDLNIRGYFFCAQRAAESMIRNGGGNIVNITSIHAFGGMPRHTVYAATKGAVVSFTKQLAIELAPCRIRVNAVGPGLIEVPRTFDAIKGYTTELGDSVVPWQRVGRPEDIAGAVSFLSSDSADFVTGQVLYVDGGTTSRVGLWWDRPCD